MSQGLKFMTIEALPNRQIKTIKEKICTICRLYQDHGFGVESTYADAEFEPLRPDFPFLNTSDADDHQPDIEWAVRTMKDRIHSTYSMLPFKYILTEFCHMAHFWMSYGRCTIPGSPIGRSEGLPRRWTG